MATTYTYTGNIRTSGYFQAEASVELSGAIKQHVDQSIAFNNAGGDEPDIQGFFYGIGSISGAVDMLLAHASDPMQGAGDATYCPGFTVAGSKLKFLRIRNTTAAGGGNLAIARGAANGLPIFDAAGDALSLPPQGEITLHLQTGTAALTTGSNDKLTVTPSSGTVTFTILAVYGG